MDECVAHRLQDAISLHPAPAVLLPSNSLQYLRSVISITSLAPFGPLLHSSTSAISKFWLHALAEVQHGMELQCSWFPGSGLVWVVFDIAHCVDVFIVKKRTKELQITGSC